MPEIQAAAAAAWTDTTPVQAGAASRWVDAVVIQSTGTPYTRPAAPAGGVVVTEGSLAPRTEIVAAPSYRSTAAAVVRNLRLEAPDNVMPAISGSISLPDGSALWRLSATVPRAQYEALRAGKQPPLVSVAIAGGTWAFIVDDMKAPRAFASTDVSINGVSVAALADAPYELERQWTNDAPTTAAQIASMAQTFTGLDVAWQVADWTLPSGAWAYTGTPWGVVTQVAGAVRAVVEADPAEVAVRVTSRYPVLPAEWATTPPDVQVAWEAVESENVTARNQALYDAVYVAGPGESLAAVRLAGTSGANQAPMLTGPLLTDLPGQVELARTVLAQSGMGETVTRTLQVLDGAGQPGVIGRGQLVRWVDPNVTWAGMVRGVTVTWGFGEVRQTVECERRLTFPSGTYVPPVVPSNRPVYLLDAPMVTSADDMADTPATPTLQNLVSFGSGGALVVWGGASSSGSSINYIGAAKLNANLNTNRFAMAVRIKIDPTWTGPAGNGSHRVFGFSSGPVEVAFSFWASGAAVRVFAWVYNFGVLMGPGVSGAPEIFAPEDAEYEIEWTGTDTLRFKVDGVLLYETNFARMSGGNLYCGNGIYRNGPVPLQMQFRALRVYTGTLVGDLPE